MQKGKLLYSGKAKSLYACDDSQKLIMQFRDDTSAFNGVKLAKLADKGKVNNYFNAHIMQLLKEQGIPVHFEQVLNETESLVKALQMIPIECVIRNVAAGGLCKRLGIALGTALNSPIFELFYKSDALGDPMINTYHVSAFGWASEQAMETMQALTFRINDILKQVFSEAGILLVDYKLEFGLYDGQVYLGDEFTPDGCRLWDAATQESLDKDRFRQDKGDVVESYRIAADRLNVKMSG